MITTLTQILEDAWMNWAEYRGPFDILSIKSPKAGIFNFLLSDSCISRRLDVRLASCKRQLHFQKAI